MHGTAKRHGWTALGSAIGSAGLALVIVSASAGTARAEGSEATAAPTATLAQADAPPPPHRRRRRRRRRRPLSWRLLRRIRRRSRRPRPRRCPPPVPKCSRRSQSAPGCASAACSRASDPSKVNDWHMDNAYVELHAGGKIHQKVSVTLNLNANMVGFGDSTATTAAGQIGSTVGLMDAIISFDFHRRVPPVGRPPAGARRPRERVRSVLHDPLELPGSSRSTPLPKEGPYGRNNGAVIWGDIAAGKLTYLAGVFDNANVGTSPLFSGRVRLALLGSGARASGATAATSATRTSLSIGVGGQFQKNGSTHDAGRRRTTPRSTSTCSSRRSSAAAPS